MNGDGEQHLQHEFLMLDSRGSWLKFARVARCSTCFWLLQIDSRDFSLAEKKITAWKTEQIH